MDSRVKQLWIDALRSGEYEQGDGALLMEGKYCCLGVLCDVYKKETSLGTWSPEPSAAGYFRFEADGGSSDVELPPAVAHWAGVDISPEIATRFRESGPITSLIEANDDDMTFKEIADIIEDEL